MVADQEWRKSKEYRQWRIAVVRRDKCCLICESRKLRSAHHIEDASYHPESRYDVENGVTLCSKCHINFHTNFKKSFRMKCTKDDWENFKCLVNYLGSLNVIKELV